MKITKKLVCFGLLSCCFAAPELYAAENCSGLWVQVGTTVVIFDDDHNAPGHMAVGVCDARTPRCTYTDRGGDTWTDDVSVAGLWKTVSGTGKYANQKSSGWSRTARIEYRPEGRVYVGAWGGECSR